MWGNLTTRNVIDSFHQILNRLWTRGSARYIWTPSANQLSLSGSEFEITRVRTIGHEDLSAQLHGPRFEKWKAAGRFRYCGSTFRKTFRKVKFVALASSVATLRGIVRKNPRVWLVSRAENRGMMKRTAMLKNIKGAKQKSQINTARRMQP